MFDMHCLVDLVMEKAGVSPLEAYDKCRELADAMVCCDYGLHMTISGWSEQVAQEMDLLVKEKGVICKESSFCCGLHS